MPPFNALRSRSWDAVTAFSVVLTHLKAQSFPLLPLETVELRDHGYSSTVVNKSITSLSNTNIHGPFRGSVSRLVIYLQRPHI